MNTYNAEMGREKNLLKNAGIIAIGQLSSKFFTFLLLPVYTTLLSPDDYGTIDVLQTVMSLALYVITLQLECAVFRYIIENRDDVQDQQGYVFSGLVALGLMLPLSTLVIVIANFFVKIPYIELFILSIFSQSLYYYFSNIARGLGKNIDYSITSFIVTFSSLLTNIVLIVVFRQGAYSILVALIFSNLIGATYYFFKLKIWRYFQLSNFSKYKLKTMLSYSLPLIPNAVSWWIANTSDRIIILLFIGASANGIYAAANKIPTIYTTLFSVFNVAWTESVSLAMKDQDCAKYVDKIMNQSFRFFSFLNLGIIVCVSLFFNLLIGEQYEESYIHIYILLIAIFVNSLCSLQGGILAGLKNTKAIGWTTAIGAVVNFIFNVCFVKFIGLYAASLSTLVSYIVIYNCRNIAVSKEIQYTFSTKYMVELFTMAAFVTVGYFARNYYFNATVLIITVIWGISRNQEILQLVLNVATKKIKGR